MIFQHGLDGVTQQGGIVARQRGHDQHSGLALQASQRSSIIGEAFETAQLAKWFVNFNALMNGHIDFANLHSANAKLGLDIIFAQAVHEFIAC